MKRLIGLLFIVGMLSGIQGCKKMRPEKEFTIGYTAQFQISSTIGVNTPVDIPTPDVTTNSTTVFENNDTRSEWIEEITLRHLNLEITAPPGETFSFLKSITLFISADGLGELELASKSNISSDASRIELDVSTSDFSEYIKKDTYSIRTELVTDEAILQDVDVKMDLGFKVRARTKFF